MKPTRLDYCLFLLTSHTNFTITQYADLSPNLSHDSINRFMQKDKMTSRLVWEHVKDDIVASPSGCIIFDDTVLDKNHSHSIELVHRQYSGNKHGIIKGIGMVNCLYVNPDTGQYWILDYRIFDPDGDGKSKIDHVKDMLLRLVARREITFDRVLMDTWYAAKDFMLLIDSLGKIYYCPLRDNRLVDDSAGQRKYCRADSLIWSMNEKAHGKMIKIRGFPGSHRVKLFRVEVSTNRTDWVATNDFAQNSTDATQDVCGIRWKVEQFHRELKQLTGVEKCQCRKARIQRNHIACAVLVWIRLTAIARKMERTIYDLKHSMLSNFLRQELRNPSVSMRFA